MRLLKAPAALTTLLLLVAAVLTGATPAGAAGSSSPRWAWPLSPVPRVVRYFEPPSTPYGPGHRGVDLAGIPGQEVLAVADGRVRFAGSVAGRGVVVVDHGDGLRSTYQPVFATVAVGTRVRAGSPVGELETVHSHCLPEACLHLGALRGDRYVNPLDLLGARPVRLVPLRGLPAPPTILPMLWLPGGRRAQPPGPRGQLDEQAAAPPESVRPMGQTCDYALGCAWR